MISAKCKKCKKKYKLKDTAAGKTINCECGNAVEVPTETDEEKNQNSGVKSSVDEAKNSDEEVTKSKPNRRTELPDLTNKKVCSKCKNIFDMSVRICPKCGFNTTGTNYDKAHREAVTRKYSQRIYHIGKYVIPIVILLLMLLHFKMQMNNLTALKNLDKNVDRLLKNEMTDKLNQSKLNPEVDTMLRYYREDKEKLVYFIPVPKKNEDKKMSIFGNGFFTLKKAGICYIVRYNKDSRALPRYYIEGEDGAPKLINPREYELVKFSSIAFNFVYTEY